MIDYSKMEKEIRGQAKKWLESGEVKYVIGYEKGKNSVISRPTLVYKPEDVDKLVWNAGCVNNLTRYLVEEMKVKPKRGEEPDLRPVGIVVKPCDSKSIVELIKENIVPRERVKIIGVNSKGSVNPKKLQKELEKLPIDMRNNVEIFEDEKNFILKYDGKEKTIKKEEIVSDKCKVCVVHKPVIADLIVGEEEKEFQADNFADIKDIEDMSLEERWKFWEDQISRCVRCYACRDGCSLCYCEECVFDRIKPYKWNEKSVEFSENAFYHLVRAMHLAGRCIDCGDCERACPMDIPIRKLNRILLKSAKKRFKVFPGINVDDKCMFGTFELEDPQEEIW